MNVVRIDGDRLVVEPVGLDRLWALRRRIEVPLTQARAATYDPGASHEARGLRDAEFARLYLTVGDARALVDRINAAAAGEPRSVRRRRPRCAGTP